MNNLKQNDLLSKSNSIDFSSDKIVYSEQEIMISWEDNVQIINILEGEGTYTINGKKYPVRANTIIIINPDELYSASAILGRNILYQNFRFNYEALISKSDHSSTYSFMEPLLKKDRFLPNIILPSMPIHSMISNLFYQVSTTYDVKSESKYLLLKSYVFHILYLFYFHHYVYKRHIGPHITRDGSVIVKESISYIMDHVYEKISLGDLCDSVQTSKPHLCRTFKRHTNQTVTEFINEYKINKAIHLLKETDDSVMEIADILGYDNISYFIKRFKEKTFLTPAQFRKI